MYRNDQTGRHFLNTTTFSDRWPLIRFSWCRVCIGVSYPRFSWWSNLWSVCCLRTHQPSTRACKVFYVYRTLQRNQKWGKP